MTEKPQRLFRSSSRHHRERRGREERRRERRGDSISELPLFLFRRTGGTVDGRPEWWRNGKEFARDQNKWEEERGGEETAEKRRRGREGTRNKQEKCRGEKARKSRKEGDEEDRQEEAQGGTKSA